MVFLVNLLPFILSLLPEIGGMGVSRTADLVFAGDAMMHAAQISSAVVPEGSYSFSECFEDIRPYIEAADYAVVNLEASLGGAPYTGYPCFSAPDEYAMALKTTGFDFFLLANNHILDRRDKGLHRTLETLSSLGIPYSGVYHDSAARDSLVPANIDVNGFKISLLNYTYGTNGIEVRGDAVVDYIDRNKIAADVAAARKSGAELIAVCIHWGEEYKLLPNRSQKMLADELTAMGVDMIIGGHPHVVQPMELRSGPEGRPVLVVYSLGNLISNMKTTDTRGGALVRVSLERDSAGAARVGSAAYGLVFVEKPGVATKNFRLRPAHAVESESARSFRKNAERIFSTYNIGVEADSLFLKLK